MSYIYILGYVFVGALIIGLFYSIIRILISFVQNFMSKDKHNSFHLHHEH